MGLYRRCQIACTPTFSQSMERQFDSGEGPTADLPADLVEAHPAAYDQLLDGLVVLAHVGGELLQGGELQRDGGLLVLGADIGAVRQAVEAVVALGARHLVLPSRHFCSRLKVIFKNMITSLSSWLLYFPEIPNRM